MGPYWKWNSKGMQSTQIQAPPSPEPAATRQPAPELLDELPAQDPRALESRRDLRRINVLMGHVPRLVEAWRRSHPDRWVQTIVELGAGDGTFLLEFARAIAPDSRQFKVILVDRINLVKAEILDGFRELGWQPEVVTADAFEWIRQAHVADAAFVCNLFLHHFTQERLKLLAQLVAERASLFVALEPRRAFAALMCSKLLGLIGCNSVTRHDAVVSVRAGFKDKEITALWPNRGWYVQEGPCGLFTHGFVAQQFGPAPGKP